jgi:hypothetical protein
MSGYWIRLFCSLIIIGLIGFSLSLYAETPEDDFGDPFNQENESGDDFGDPFGQDEESEDAAIAEDETTGSLPDGPGDEWKPDISLSGDISYTPLVRISPDDDISMAYNAMAGNMNIAYSFGDCDIAGKFHLELDPFSYENLYKLSVGELFFAYHTDVFHFRAGYSSLDWSLMNAFKLTNYFHTPVSLFFDLDLFSLPPELIAPLMDYSAFVVDEEPSDPMLGIRFLVFYKIFSLEIAAGPPFFYNDLPYNIEEMLSVIDMPGQVNLSLTDTLPENILANGEIAARLGMTLYTTDLYFSYFHGFDRRQFYTTTTAVVPPDSLNIDIERKYSIVDKAGLSISADVLGCVLNAEAVFTFSDPVLYYMTTSFPDPLGDMTDVRRMRTTSLEISAGSDWELSPVSGLSWNIMITFSLKRSRMSWRKSSPGIRFLARSGIP